MKEAYRPTPIEIRPAVTAVPQQISRETLTVRPQIPYSGREGILFMGENSDAELGHQVPRAPSHPVVQTQSSGPDVKHEDHVDIKPHHNSLSSGRMSPEEQARIEDIGLALRNIGKGDATSDAETVIDALGIPNVRPAGEIGKPSEPPLATGDVKRMTEIVAKVEGERLAPVAMQGRLDDARNAVLNLDAGFVGNPEVRSSIEYIKGEATEDRVSSEKLIEVRRMMVDRHLGEPGVMGLLRDLNGAIALAEAGEKVEREGAEPREGARDRGRARGGRGERETTRTPAREVQIPSEEVITDPTLRSYRETINDFAGRSQGMEEEEVLRAYSLLRNEIDNVAPPEGYSADEQNQYDLQKQLLLSTMAEIFASKTPSDGEAEHIGGQLREALEREDYQLVDALVNRMDIDGQTYARAIRNAIENVSGHEHMIEYLLEYGVERILSIADSSPQESYPQFNLYQQQNLDSVMQSARSYDERFPRGDQRMFAYLTNLKARRYAMHELFRSMKDKKSYLGLVTSLLRKRGFDFVEKEIVGVADVQRLYEKVLASNLSLKKGWLSDTDFAEADRQVEALLGRSANNIFQKEMRLPDGTQITRQIRPWEVRRAALMGRSLNAASQRRLVYGVLGDLPENVDELIKSREFEFIARSLAPMKLLPQRFFDWPVARRYIEFFLERKKKEGKYGLERNGEIVGLYGKSVDSSAILDLGIPDPKSNSWRARLMFLKQEDYANIDDGHGHHIAVGHYLDGVRHHVEERVKEQAHKDHPNISGLAFDQLIESAKQPYAARIKAEFNREVRGAIQDQRLFLGVLMRFPDLDDANKQAIWENVAQLLPSRVAAFLPKETLDIVKQQYGIGSDEAATERWNEIKVKLFLAEEKRVVQDGQNLKRGGSGVPTTLGACLSSAGLDASERAIITRLQSLGHDNAKEFAEIKFPFTAFLDDVPKTDWINLTDEDFDRLLVNDQGSFDEGYGKIMGIISNPGAKPEDVVKAFEEGYENIKSPIGVRDSQKQLKPFISAYLDMVAIRDSAKWFGSAMGLLRIPRSEVERFNLQSHITMDENKVSMTLHKLAQAEVISDDPTEANAKGQTVMIEMLDEHKANKRALLMHWARVILLILGPVAGLEFLKLVLPGDILKG